MNWLVIHKDTPWEHGDLWCVTHMTAMVVVVVSAGIKRPSSRTRSRTRNSLYQWKHTSDPVDNWRQVWQGGRWNRREEKVLFSKTALNCLDITNVRSGLQPAPPQAIQSASCWFSWCQPVNLWTNWPVVSLRWGVRRCCCKCLSVGADWWCPAGHCL